MFGGASYVTAAASGFDIASRGTAPRSTYPRRPGARAVPRRVPPADPHPVRPIPDLLRAARRGGFHTEVGFRVDVARSRRGLVTVTGAVERRHLNINGVVHGGVYATILDTAMGASVVSLLGPNETTATTSLYVEFLRAAREGETLSARGEVLRRGRHIAFAEGNLFGSDGRRYSQAHGTWYIWSDEDRVAPAGSSVRATRRAPGTSARRARGS
jgi:uncharacterized protein (TIGR00369 family)